MTIDPMKRGLQAPPGLRVGSRGFARRQRAAMAGQPPPAAEADDDEDEDEEEDADSSERGEGGDPTGGEHEAARAAAEEAHTRAAEALQACKGTDSAAALMHAEDAGDEAGEAHDTFKASSMKLRGAAPEETEPPKKEPVAPTPAPPAAAVARAVSVIAGGDAAVQLEVTRDAALGRKLRALFGGATHDETEGLARAAHQDAAEAVGLREAAAKTKKTQERRARADADAALRRQLSAAVRAGKYLRAEVFDIAEGKDPATDKPVEILTPKAWLRDMAPAARAAMIAAKQARAGGPPILPDDTAQPISAAVRDYCRARGITDEKTIRSLEAQMTGGTPAAQEHA